MDGDGPGLQLDVLAVADPLVGAHTVDLDGRDGAGHLLDPSGQARQRLPQALLGQVVRPAAVGRGDLALGVLGGGLHPEADGDLVGLVRSHQIGEEPGGTPNPQGQQAGGHGVEGAGVAHLAGGGQAPGGTDDVMAGQPLGLVHQEDPVGGRDGSASDLETAPARTVVVALVTGPRHRLSLLGDVHRTSASRAGPCSVVCSSSSPASTGSVPSSPTSVASSSSWR